MRLRPFRGDVPDDCQPLKTVSPLRPWYSNQHRALFALLSACVFLQMSNRRTVDSVLRRASSDCLPQASSSRSVAAFALPFYAKQDRYFKDFHKAQLQSQVLPIDGVRRISRNSLQISRFPSTFAFVCLSRTVAIFFSLITCK